MLLLIDNYDSFTYNLVQYLGELGAECAVHRNDALTAEAALALSPQAIIISPGPCTPNEAGISLGVIPLAAQAGIPLLGVCLGHQALGQAYGATVKRAPEPVHGKVGTMIRTGTGRLLAALPERFEATRYHSLIVDPETLPEDFIVTARSEDGLIMAMEHAERPQYGVQFHPESIATPLGHDILASFLDLAGVPRSRKAAA